VDSQQSESAKWFAQEVQPHEPALRAVLHKSFTGADVDDLVQESLVRTWRAKTKGPIESGRNFLFAVARNAVRDLIRRRSANKTIPVTENAPMDVLEDKPGVADIVSHQQDLELLAEAVRALPDRCREVFLLRKIQGLSQRDIAARLRITENTVESLVAKGARRCADYIRSKGDCR
jgi:RNA polymerase sigma factor (sigma-70 family)